MIPVTKPYLPSREKLNKYIDGIYEREWLTNNGPLAQELTRRLEDYLEVENLLLVSNGTLALQVAFRALNIHEQLNSGPVEAITTPFTFVATASALKWEGISPIFADIDRKSWCIDAEGIESLITPQTKAIVPVHVFGNACDVEKIDEIAREHNLKIVYDAAHAFGVKYNGKSLLQWGDAATLSFHATKVFQTIEGGAIIFKRKEDLERAKSLISFGLTSPETIDEVGINAKMNEFQAAMGLCVLDEIEENLSIRGALWHRYESELRDLVELQTRPSSLVYNYSYFPVVFKDENEALRVYTKLKESGVSARRYFYPSLDSVSCLGHLKDHSISQDIASRVLCLPIYGNMTSDQQKLICDVIKTELNA